jgi:tetratricopeptide (TPR) repeat protein
MAVLGLALLAGPARADSGWREIEAPHVTLRTDLGSGAARDAALSVERFRAQIIAAAWPKATLPATRIDMTVFANGLDFEQNFGRNLAGVFFHEVPPYAVMYGTADRWEHRASLAAQETTSILRHELVHHLAATVYRRQPRWFAEGLAQFLETVRPSEDGKSVVVGAVNLEAMQKYNAFRSLHVADAIAWSGKLDGLPENTIHGLYGLSWLLVHWLFNAHPEQFNQLQGLLARGIDPDKAWKIILPGLNTRDLDGALHQYVKHGDYNEFLAPYTPPAPELRETPLSEADVHAERARVALAAARGTTDESSRKEEASRELAAALKLDPGNAGALLLQARSTPVAGRAALARRITEAHPDDARGWVLLGQALARDPGASAEREAAFKRAIDLNPDNPTPLNDLAWLYVQQGKATQAAPLITKAIQLAPYNPSMLDTLAAVQAALGRCSEAAASEARALDALPDGASSKTRSAFEERLDQYRTRCTSGASSAAIGG